MNQGARDENEARARYAATVREEKVIALLTEILTELRVMRATSEMRSTDDVVLTTIGKGGGRPGSGAADQS